MEQHDQRLSRDPALPPSPHAKISAARHRRGGLKACSPLAVTRANPPVPGSDQERDPGRKCPPCQLGPGAAIVRRTRSDRGDKSAEQLTGRASSANAAVADTTRVALHVL